ncbi:MAG: hypothetical protein ACOYNN_09375, partial [Terrimicrobiaceae bacterium]
MSEDEDFSAEEIWDEYDWEKFLQEQDRTTEKYFNLLEKFMDHPDRDALIAREMGWDSSSDDIEIEEAAELFCEMDPEEMDATDETFDTFAKSPIYRDTLKLHRWINLWLEEQDGLRDHPE